MSHRVLAEIAVSGMFAVFVGGCGVSIDLSYDGPPRDGAECVPGATRDGEVCDAAGRWRRRCADGRAAAPEVCNLRDDDCDGVVDEDFVYESIGATWGSDVRVQARAATGHSILARTDERIIALVSEGAGAGNCSERIRGATFDLAGGLLGEAPLLQRIAPPQKLFARPQGADLIVTWWGRPYAQPLCQVPIAENTCPIFTSRYTASGVSRPVRDDPGVCAGSAVVSPSAVIFALPVRPVGKLQLTRDFTLYALGDDGHPRGTAHGRIQTEGQAPEGAVTDRVHWFWPAGSALGHASTDDEGRDVRVEPTLALEEEIDRVVSVQALDASLFVRVLRGASTRMVEVRRDGEVGAPVALDLYSEDTLVLSPDGHQFYACSVRFGVSFTRFDRGGSRMQRYVTLAGEDTDGECAMVAVSTGVLVIWTTGESGSLHWARIGCRAPP